MCEGCSYLGYHREVSSASSSIVSIKGGILLANSEAPKCRLTHDPSEGTKAWSTPCGNLGFVSGEIGSPTVSGGFVRQVTVTLMNLNTAVGILEWPVLRRRERSAQDIGSAKNSGMVRDRGDGLQGTLQAP